MNLRVFTTKSRSEIGNLQMPAKEQLFDTRSAIGNCQAAVEADSDPATWTCDAAFQPAIEHRAGANADDSLNLEYGCHENVSNPEGVLVTLLLLSHRDDPRVKIKVVNLPPEDLVTSRSWVCNEYGHWILT